MSSSSSIQLSFALKASSKVKTVHLSGSWDNYTGQLPLSRSDASKSGTFRGAFKFQGTVLKPEQRYWYYVGSIESIGCGLAIGC